MVQSFWSPIFLSITIAVTAGIIVVILGIIIGRLMARKYFTGKTVIETLLMLPLVLPPTVVGFLLIVIFGVNSPIGHLITQLFGQSLIFTWFAAVIAAIVVSFPLMYQSAKTGFESVDHEIEDAAKIDGAGNMQVFLKVTMPLAIQALITGGVLSITRALGEFGATLMFAGNIPGKTQTVPTAIYLAMDSGNMEMAWLWVGSIIILSYIMLFAIYRRT
ncbi:molybdate ABC transporter permease subunit [Pseudalkalibacillus salsuginis]|uniref:molybdate ABC transporter permease subunit n=1 Tax=Pseudalkalibacillus salsuginis TaxID=2910972 RepID=UPI001F3AC1E6|nr:molybdate ABC transporter permease subunit [Pseudalkalibacillus salsuginis]MCF6411228.1 molybdate ABC transporter permease subunit [Pseudalkalibacillus salsuginis]